jgi:hypothetical protein
VAKQKHQTKQIKNILQKTINAMGKLMDDQATRATLGLSNSFRDADRNDTVPYGLWQNLPSTN